MESLVLSGGVVIDSAAEAPLEGGAIWIEDGRIKAVGPKAEIASAAPSAQSLDVSGKFLVPGLMNGNVHLMGGCFSVGNLLRYYGAYEDLVLEAAQVALRSGLTTVFDTLGPRAPLQAVQGRISRGEVQGARFFCAGWIVGLDGLLSLDFSPRGAEILSAHMVEQINGLCAENVGPALSWMGPDQVRAELRTYIAKGVDFIKYASNEHRWGDPTTSLVFSPRVQAAIVDETHRAGLTAQAHTSSIESLHVAVEAGCDLVQHCNITGPFPIPQETLDLIVERGVGAVVFPFTQRRFDWIMANCEIDRAYFAASDLNCRNLLDAGAKLMLANDGGVWGPELASDPRRNKFWLAPGEDNLSDLDQGHFVWLKAMEEKGMRPLDLLKAATLNIAEAYGLADDLGSLRPGRRADILVLDKDPLASSENYRSLNMIFKDGKVVDREALPTRPILETRLPDPSHAVLAYRDHRHIGRSGFPLCACCVEL